MQESELKTKPYQRAIIFLIAILLLGSTIAIYIFSVMGGSGSSSSSETKIAELQAEYEAKAAELDAAAQPFSDKYFSDFKGYLKNIKAYNAATVNKEGLKTTDLKVGTGRTLGDDDTDYFAYYIGWCADGTIFDSSFDDAENPTKLKAPLDPSVGLIEGWEQGIVGAKLGGVRQISMNGEIAYGDSQEICGGTNSPLKFIVLPIEKDENLAKISSELDDIYLEMVYTAYGVQL